MRFRTILPVFVKRLVFAFLILAGFAHSSFAGLLTGMTPGGYSLPAGWVVVRTQDFEGTKPSEESWGGAQGSVTTTKPHSGSYSIEGEYAWSMATTRWRLNTGYTGSFDEIYVSWYEWVDADAVFNDEYWMVQFAVDAPVFQEVFWGVWWGGPNMEWNWPESQLWAVGQGSRSTRLGYVMIDPAEGSWVQFEAHYKPNTPGNSDGFMRLYKNGTLISEENNWNFNGTVSMDDCLVQVGGHYLVAVWMKDYPTCTICGTKIGDGIECQVEMGWSYEPFSEPICNPPIASFSRYIDDIIVMKYTGGGIDTDPPSVNNKSPDSGETGWPVATDTVSFTVNDPSGVDSSTLNFNINGGTNRTCGSGLTCTPSGDPTSLSVVYTRGSPWEYDTTYTAYITSVYDLVGNQQVTNWQFTTEAYVPSDTTPPALTSSTPSSGQTGWELNNWQVVFDISDAGNIDDTTLQFNIDGGATQTCGSGLTCNWVIPITQLRATYSRGSDWVCNKTYTANIPQVKDTTGNTLTTSWTFSTVACPPDVSPSGDFIIHIHED